MLITILLFLILQTSSVTSKAVQLVSLTYMYLIILYLEHWSQVKEMQQTLCIFSFLLCPS